MNPYKIANWLMLFPVDDDPFCQVLPVDDEREHELHGTECWCRPRVMKTDPEDGTPFAYPLVVHNAADCREVVEWAQEILDQENAKR